MRAILFFWMLCCAIMPSFAAVSGDYVANAKKGDILAESKIESEGKVVTVRLISNGDGTYRESIDDGGASDNLMFSKARIEAMRLEDKLGEGIFNKGSLAATGTNDTSVRSLFDTQDAYDDFANDAWDDFLGSTTSEGNGTLGKDDDVPTSSVRAFTALEGDDSVAAAFEQLANGKDAKKSKSIMDNIGSTGQKVISDFIKAN